MKRFDRPARARPNLGRAAPPGSAPSASPRQARLLVAEMGARGDAVAESDEGPVYLPYALPGETVDATLAGERATSLIVVSPSTERVAPPCQHFGRCCGCQLQHWADAPYLAWKREQVMRALARRGIEAPVEEIVVAWGEGRRRAAFHGQRVGKMVRFGFVERGGAKIEPIRVCPVLSPDLATALPRLRALTEIFAPARGEINLQALATETGLDVAVKGAGKPQSFDRARLERASAAAEEADLARLSFDGEVLVARRKPMLSMGRARVSPPPGAFVQATLAGEEALGRLVMDALHGAERVADLFSGIGTFALRAADIAETLAVEADAEMLTALKQAADAVGGLRGVATERRDLLRAPLASLELKRFDAIVFDPPRAGARLQAEQIGQSKAKRVVAVSCDPATFARDARVLIDAGFKLTRVTPVDQFRWTPHIEVVGAFER
jgi:23S rRNA (uracil1939-C5)-methyltransferase